MNSHLFATLWLSVAASVALAQQHPAVASLDLPANTTSPLDLVWEQTSTAGIVALRWQEDPQEHTLLMIHTTIDASTTGAGALVTKGVLSALPFLASPEGGFAYPTFAPAAKLVVEAGSEPSMIPTERVAAFVEQFVASGYAAGFGSSNPGASPVTRYAHPQLVTLPASATAADERQPWAQPLWGATPWAPEPPRYSFSSGELGAASVLQAAHAFAAQLELNPINATGIAALQYLIGLKLGFEIYVQPIAVVPATGGGDTKIKFKRHVRLRRYSLLGDENEQWLALKGAPRHVPDVQDERRRIYLAPFGEEMHIEFPMDVSSATYPNPLRAYVPTTTGFVIVPQLANPIVDHAVLRPSTAIFRCPANAIFGIMLIEDTRAPGIPVLPKGATGMGADLWVFQPPQ
jgi:hypothetical protein